MLTARRSAAAAVLALLLLGAPAQSAVADGPGGGVVCPPKELDCEITAQDPGKPADSKPGKPAGSGGGGAGKATCAIDGESVPCSTKLGKFNPADACYWQVLDPQPGPDDPIWTFASGVPDDWKPGDKGKLWNVTCPGAGRQVDGGTYFSETGPAGGGVDIQALAQQAVNSMKLAGPKVASPRAAGRYVVGMPMWMWVDQSVTTYGPNTASATAGGVTVTATAQVSSIRWDMGDGTTVTCTGPGTRYDASYGREMSPDCGHRYQQTSVDQTGGRYRGTATSTWTIDWEVAGGGAGGGQLTETRQTAFTVEVREVQVLNN